jgi:non-heme chloroperoxidase
MNKETPNAYQHEQHTMNDQGIVSTVRLGSREQPAIVLLPGLTGSFASYQDMAEFLCEHLGFQVVYVDYRCHQPKDTASQHGMRIARMAKDVYEIIEALELKQPTLLGHSLGCGIIWSYIELFSTKNISHFILIDQSPTIVSPGENTNADKECPKCSLIESTHVFEMIYAIRNPDTYAQALNNHFKQGFITEAARKQGKLARWIDDANKMNPANIARLMQDTLNSDWSDMIHTIDKPTLVLGGVDSMVPSHSQAWISQQIKQATLKIFSHEEGGVHAMFLDPCGFIALKQALSDFFHR